MANINYQHSIITYICTADKSYHPACELYYPSIIGKPGSICRHFQWYNGECKANNHSPNLEAKGW